MARAAGAGARHRLMVLGYHNLTPTLRWPAPGGGADAFARQLKVLRRVATLVPLEASLDALDAGAPLPARAVAITFDDGYRDNLTDAVPVLRALGVPATIYLVPGFLSREVHAWWERLGWAVGAARAAHVEFGGARLPLATPEERATALRTIETAVKRTDHDTRLGVVEELVDRLDPAGRYDGRELFVDWDGARDLVRSGFTVGSHTCGHAILAREDAEAQRKDLVRCRELLQSELSVPVPGLAYPNGERGDYDAATIAAAREAGHTHAVTTWGRLADIGRGPFQIGRRMVTAHTPPLRLAAAVLRNFATA